MKTANKITFMLVSMLVISNIIFFKINYDLYVDFSNSIGKKRALFGLYYLEYFYVTYIFIIELISLIFIFIFNNKNTIRALSILLLLVSSFLIFFEPWQLFT